MYRTNNAIVNTNIPKIMNSIEFNDKENILQRLDIIFLFNERMNSRFFSFFCRTVNDFSRVIHINKNIDTSFDIRHPAFQFIGILNPVVGF